MGEYCEEAMIFTEDDWLPMPITVNPSLSSFTFNTIIKWYTDTRLQRYVPLNSAQPPSTFYHSHFGSTLRVVIPLSTLFITKPTSSTLITTSSPLLVMLPWELCQVKEGCHFPTFQLPWTIGIVVGSVILGALLTLGMSCLHLLSPQSGKPSLQLRLLRIYVIALVLINVIFGVENFLWSNYFSIFEDQIANGPQLEHTFATMQLVCTFTIVLVGILTDGFLVSISIPPIIVTEYSVFDYGNKVWRCYMVQQVLMFPCSRLVRTLCWVFPASLWIAMMCKNYVYHHSHSDWLLASLGLGTTGGILTYQVSAPGRLADTAVACLTAGLAANITLNLFTTIFIIARLVLYRRLVKRALGIRRQEHRQHTRVVGMLLESAAINIPITVIAVVGIATWKNYGDFMMSVVTPGQVSHLSPFPINSVTRYWYA